MKATGQRWFDHVHLIVGIRRDDPERLYTPRNWPLAFVVVVDRVVLGEPAAVANREVSSAVALPSCLSVPARPHPINKGPALFGAYLGLDAQDGRRTRAPVRKDLDVDTVGGSPTGQILSGFKPNQLLGIVPLVDQLC